MSLPENREPPRQVWYDLEEALALLAALEDASDALVGAGLLTVLAAVEDQIQLLNRKLEFGP